MSRHKQFVPGKRWHRSDTVFPWWTLRIRFSDRDEAASWIELVLFLDDETTASFHSYEERKRATRKYEITGASLDGSVYVTAPLGYRTCGRWSLHGSAASGRVEISRASLYIRLHIDVSLRASRIFRRDTLSLCRAGHCRKKSFLEKMRVPTRLALFFFLFFVGWLRCTLAFHFLRRPSLGHVLNIKLTSFGYKMTVWY